ncbi:MAG: glucose-1-phosphate adenylyltransferase subunit GlgD [Clostridium sp.]
MNNCLGIINLDENETRMGELVRKRPLASVPIAARFRVIDFALSNMTNSGIECIGIFAKNRSRSLMDHLTNGRPWDLHRKKYGLKVFNFGDDDPSYDDVHNFADNIEFVKCSKRKYVLLSPSYMICNIDFNDVVKAHKNENNDVTIVYKNINNANKEFIDCDVLNIDSYRNVVSVGENIGKANNANINMEMYLMRTELFIDIVNESIRSGMYRKIKQFIHANLTKLKVGTHEFKGYLSCINSLKAYYESNMDFLDEEVNREIFCKDRPIYTKPKDEGPTQYTNDSNVKNSLVANGCFIEGEVTNSIISRRVKIGKNVKIKDCIIMQNATIENGCELERIIADKNSKVGEEERYIGSKNWPIVIQRRNGY